MFIDVETVINRTDYDKFINTSNSTSVNQYLYMCLDKSGSMNWTYSDTGENHRAKPPTSRWYFLKNATLKLSSFLFPNDGDKLFEYNRLGFFSGNNIYPSNTPYEVSMVTSKA